MTISIECLDPDSPVPRQTVMTLSCDGYDHGLLPPVAQQFTDPAGFMVYWATAMSSGWKVTYRDGQRLFLGPCCSGKARKSSGEEDAC